MPFLSKTPAVIVRLHRGIDDALLAAVQIPMAATKRDLAQGFRGGAETTGASAASIKSDGPKGDYEHGRYIRYGTALFWHRFWTFGGMNAFTRQFERVDLYTPNFYENQGPMLAAAQVALKKAIG